MFEQRFKYFLATNKRNKRFYIQSTGTTTLEESRLQLQKTQEESPLQQAMIHHQTIFTKFNQLITNYSQHIKSSFHHHKDDDDDNDDHSSISSTCGTTLTTSSSGFLSGQFHVPTDKVLDSRLIQIQSTCKEGNNHRFSPNYGIVNLVEPTGLSIISDIDDTIKDTRILSGARAVLSKTFFEAPEDVSGMSDAYMSWYLQGASFHYVSNSPFQLMPMLDKFLRDANFPPGSMHLRDDSKLLSRLVETPGQAKRDAIIRILEDFPQRKFILVGDSGELDLEIYTRLATEFPDQILKIYIRDVTTPCHKKAATRTNTLTSLFSSKRSSSTSSTSSTEEQQQTKKKRFPLGMRRAVATTIAEYAMEPQLTGHQNIIHLEPQEIEDGLVHQDGMTTLEACSQLYDRVEKARLQVPEIDIILFQDARTLEQDDTYTLFDSSVLSSSPQSY